MKYKHLHKHRIVYVEKLNIDFYCFSFTIIKYQIIINQLMLYIYKVLFLYSVLIAVKYLIHFSRYQLRVRQINLSH